MKNSIKNAFDNSGYKYQVFNDENRTIFKLGIGLENGKADCLIIDNTGMQQTTIYITGPMNVPENKRSVMADFLTKANYGMTIGNFEMDFDDGEIKFKNSFNYDNTYPQSEEKFLKDFLIACAMLDRHLPGIMAIMYGQTSSTEALSQVREIINPHRN